MKTTKSETTSRIAKSLRVTALIGVILIALVTILGKGGGDGAPAGGGGGSSVGPTAEINSATAPDISGATVESVILASTAVVDAPVGGLGGSGISPSSLGASKNGGSSLMEEIPATTEPCPSGGSITISGNIADPDLLVFQGVLLPGDNFNSDFNACDIGFGLITNGGFDFTVNSFSGVIFDLFDIDLDGNFRNFSLSSDGSTFQINGQFDASIVSTTFPISTVIASSPQLDISINPEGFAATLFDYSETSTTDFSGFPEICTTDASGSLQSSEFSGEVEFVTTEDFSGDCFDNPSSGSALITGADGATINLIVIDSNNVELHIDLDADGIVDEVQARTWDELLPLAL